MEGGTAVAIFVRCFTDKSGIEQELKRRLYVKFPREVLATISVKFRFLLTHLLIGIVLNTNFDSFWVSNYKMLQILLVLMTTYGSAALGQLFFFHVILIRKVNFYGFSENFQLVSLFLFVSGMLV